MVANHLKLNSLEQRVFNHHLDLAETTIVSVLDDYHIVERPIIGVNTRLSTALGRCILGPMIPWQIEFNPDILLVGSDADIADIARHEATHLVLAIRGLPYDDGDYYFELALRNSHTQPTGTYRFSHQQLSYLSWVRDHQHQYHFNFYAECTSCHWRYPYRRTSDCIATRAEANAIAQLYRCERCRGELKVITEKVPVTPTALQRLEIDWYKEQFNQYRGEQHA